MSGTILHPSSPCALRQVSQSSPEVADVTSLRQASFVLEMSYLHSLRLELQWPPCSRDSYMGSGNPDSGPLTFVSALSPSADLGFFHPPRHTQFGWLSLWSI